MELFIAIAMLCQVDCANSSDYCINASAKYQTSCQQSLLHCVKLNTIKLGEKDAMTKCVLERKP